MPRKSIHKPTGSPPFRSDAFTSENLAAVAAVVLVAQGCDPSEAIAKARAARIACAVEVGRYYVTVPGIGARAVTIPRCLAKGS